MTEKLKRYRFLLLGLVGAIFLYVSAAGIISVTYPWFVNDNSDELAHVDMIWRIWNGDLPKASDGLRYKPFIEMGGGNVYQRAAGHPPLYHIIMAPFMGPLLNKGEWRKAIAVGRAINIVIGILCILALAWAGWLLGGDRRSLFAVAVPALGVLIYRFTRINTDLSMDGLLTLWSVLTLINLYKILQKGLKPKYLAWLMLLLVAGTATKISYLVFVGLAFATVVFVSYLHGEGDKRRKLVKGTLIGLLMVAVVILTVGWYYYFQNYKASGSFVTPISGEIPSRRVHQSYVQILGGTQFWALFYSRLSAYPAVSIIITSFSLAGYFAMQQINLFRLKIRSLKTQTVLLMLLAFVGVALTQLKFAHPTGSINFRYLLPAILPISLFLAYGLLEFKNLKGQLVAASALLLAGNTILSVRLAPSPESILPGVTAWGKDITKIYGLTAKNGIPVYVSQILLALFILGAVSLSVSLYHLAKASPKQLNQ